MGYLFGKQRWDRPRVIFDIELLDSISRFNLFKIMGKVFGYIRVSTAKQGKGVSLVEQKEAIDIYAKRNNLIVVKWFEELETASKKGRPIFSEMTKLLRRKKADGVIMHKIDRSARNMRDWSELTELADNSGIQVHFVQESVNLLRDSDRLSADMQAVVASHYIRNLRQETIKGLYGRLKQGIYPFQAPLGYLDTGAGNPKKLDSTKAPLVKEIFKLYSTQQWGIIGLAKYMNDKGLKNVRGGLISKNTISKILNNPFYAGIMRVAGQSFLGKHKPLITVKEFERVQGILSGKTVSKASKHSFVFSKLLKCSHCERSLIGEIQKGHRYYRCHTRTCPVKCFREDYFEEMLLDIFKRVNLTEDDCFFIRDYTTKKLFNLIGIREKQIEVINLKIQQASARLDSLLDLLVDRVVDQDIYNSKKEKVLYEIQKLKKSKNDLEKSGKERIMEVLENFIEPLKDLILSYENGNIEKKRSLVKKVTSNRLIYPKNVDVELFPAVAELAKRAVFESGGPERNRTPDLLSANEAL